MHLTRDQERRLRHLVEVFLTENAKINLSAYRTEEACWVGNVLDSLAVLDVLRSMEWKVESGKWKVIDVGTGGGFPALPLALLRPTWQVTAIDATRKKMEAVGRIVERFHVASDRLQVRLLTGRAEELGHRPDLRESFDLVLARAVAELPTLLEYTSPFVRVGGFVACWKSMDSGEELAASARAQGEMCCRHKGSHPYDLGGTFGRRQILLFEKVSLLPGHLPRRVGVPGKKPL